MNTSESGVPEENPEQACWRRTRPPVHRRPLGAPLKQPCPLSQLSPRSRAGDARPRLPSPPVASRPAVSRARRPESAGGGSRRQAARVPGPAPQRQPSPRVTSPRAASTGAGDIVTCRWDPADAQPERRRPGQQWRRGAAPARRARPPPHGGLRLRRFPSPESARGLGRERRAAAQL